MKKYDRIVFVAKTGTCREPMAMGILNDMALNYQIEILARGLVVQFPEPLNQKAEAVLIGNGITLEDFSSQPLVREDITESTLVLALETVHREKILELFPDVDENQVWVLAALVGEELEVLDPYGGNLANYGLCYESLRTSIKKLVKILNDWEEDESDDIQETGLY